MLAKSCYFYIYDAIAKREKQIKAQWEAARQVAMIDAMLSQQRRQNYQRTIQNNYNNQRMLNALYGIQTSITNLQ